ncbi:hypothetical protein [Kurthia sibirica]|uniref:Uncharacterized protein n=1 Tax=Kurthia sibirica TaxID=202750 RepID=A0A2U3AN72_9BACL|nr:hypothetical protein [Kurthia sibirica]PWI25993.1 hypothetical protein DEX24_05530 [Kurthia sibirica]GEK35290.1 hypothetical protein KSI01_28230 [Kurthia sibirica]
MSRVFSRTAFFFVFIGLGLLVPPFATTTLAFFSSWPVIFIGFFLYMIGACLSAVSIIKKERGTLTVVNLLGVLMGVIFIGMLMMSNDSVLK